jgi:hypothetical protein
MPRKESCTRKQCTVSRQGLMSGTLKPLDPSTRRSHHIGRDGAWRLLRLQFGEPMSKVCSVIAHGSCVRCRNFPTRVNCLPCCATRPNTRMDKSIVIMLLPSCQSARLVDITTAPQGQAPMSKVYCDEQTRTLRNQYIKLEPSRISWNGWRCE